VSNRTIFIVITAILVVAVVALLWPGKAGRGPGPGSAPSPDGRSAGVPDARSGPGQGPTSLPGAPAAPAGAIVPQARITVDGKGDDWAAVPVWLVPKTDPWRHSTYGCQGVKLARDETSLYVLFILGLGVTRRYDRQVAAGQQPSSGALGYFKFQTEGRQFNVWIPTGVSQSYGPGGKLLKSIPVAEFQVSRYNPSTKRWDEVFNADSEKAAQFVGFGGTLLELRLPLERLQITGASPFSVALEEM
jgi:hypothetical protein